MADEEDFANTPPEQPNAHGPGLRETLARINSGEHRGYSDTAEYKAYRRKLDAQRYQHTSANAEKPVIDMFERELKEPDVTSRRRDQLNRMIGRSKVRQAGARAGAKAMGVDPDAPFPRDEWMYHGGKPPGWK